MNIQMRGSTAEVLLYEDIGGWFGITADSFIREVKSLKDVSTINLRINSNGGNVFDGIAIYNYLKSHQARIEVDVDGIAASIASIIAMAGDEVRMADNGWMMIHDPWVVTGGTSDELRKTADTMDGIRESLLDTYMVKAQVERQQVSDMMVEETWLNAADAVEVGLADAATEEMKVAAAVHKDWFRHPPEQLPVEEIKAEKETKETKTSDWMKQNMAHMEQTLRQRKL